MFPRTWRRGGAERRIAEALYERIVAAARQPAFYADWDVPDTPLGRFELLALHMFLVQHRLRGRDGVLREAAQLLVDGFFTELDHSMRELGIGDLGVPKRMKKFAAMFYGRATSYGQALVAGDREALAAALARNIRPDRQGWLGAWPLSDYVIRADAALTAQPDAALEAGTLAFPPAARDAEAAPGA